LPAVSDSNSLGLRLYQTNLWGEFPRCASLICFPATVSDSCFARVTYSGNSNIPALLRSLGAQAFPYAATIFKQPNDKLSCRAASGRTIRLTKLKPIKRSHKRSTLAPCYLAHSYRSLYTLSNSLTIHFTNSCIIPMAQSILTKQAKHLLYSLSGRSLRPRGNLSSSAYNSLLLKRNSSTLGRGLRLGATYRTTRRLNTVLCSSTHLTFLHGQESAPHGRRTRFPANEITISLASAPRQMSHSYQTKRTFRSGWPPHGRLQRHVMHFEEA
jgi:hypothetical protein